MIERVIILQPRRYIAVAILFLMPVSSQAAHISVEERGGNIYLHDSKTGRLKRLSGSGHDRSPALSPDASYVVFVRDLLGDSDYNDPTRTGPAIRVMQLWVADVAGDVPPRLVLDSPVEVQGR